MKVNRKVVVDVELESGDFSILHGQAIAYTTTHYPDSKTGIRAMVQKAFMHGAAVGAATMAGVEPHELHLAVRPMGRHLDCRQCQGEV